MKKNYSNKMVDSEEYENKAVLVSINDPPTDHGDKITVTVLDDKEKVVDKNATDDGMIQMNWTGKRTRGYQERRKAETAKRRALEMMRKRREG